MVLLVTLTPLGSPAPPFEPISMLSLLTREALTRRSKSAVKCFGAAGLTGYALFKVAAWKLNDYIDAYQAEIASTEMYTCPSYVAY